MTADEAYDLLLTAQQRRAEALAAEAEALAHLAMTRRRVRAADADRTVTIAATADALPRVDAAVIVGLTPARVSQIIAASS